ncbi:MAG: DUF1295 domain-containing protein [Leptospiraceae bacterium]|nr:DUF1295 domain-containing protein [Leptospiraceae bacterium]MCP5496936.1 DUF1295 domain-containing protein [Leptospiraceae bacterium]
MNHSHYIIWSLLIYTAISRIAELYKASQNQKIRKQNPDVRVVHEPYYFLFVLLHSSIFILVPFEIIYFNRQFFPVLGGICFIVFVFASFLRFYILRTLKSYWNTKLIHNPSSHEIITTGPYKYIRHPNYLVVILELSTLSLFHTAYFSFIFLSLWNAIMLFIRIQKEEKILFQNTKYKEHFSDKKRFVPFII